jgi:RNA polymerase sigma factor (sigma-70 family)
MAGDHDFAEDLDRLVEHDYVRLVRAVALFSGTTEGAEDAVQEALARAMEQVRKGRRIEHLGPWVVTTAFNQRRSARQRERGGALAGRRPDAEGPDADALGSQLLDLRAAVRSLPSRQRQVVVLHYYLDQPVSSIGDVLGIKESAVKNALRKARGSLLAALTMDNTPRSAQ